MPVFSEASHKCLRACQPCEFVHLAKTLTWNFSEAMVYVLPQHFQIEALEWRPGAI